jgi:hypothetical protein
VTSTGRTCSSAGSTAPRRLLSLLVYVQSDDLVVPDRVVRELAASIDDG